jgi:dTMP kinase
MSSPGRFITLEGIDGAGKSTHIPWIVSYIETRGKAVVNTREPGGTPLGEKLRGLLLNDAMDSDTEALLMFAARAEHITSVIKPSLNQGKWVVSDRFTDASFAYQGGGRGMSEQKLSVLEQWVQNDLQPDLTLLFDVSLEVSQQRLQQTGIAPDRFEQEKSDFFQRVRNAYLKRAATSPHRIKVVDSTKSIESIQQELESILSPLFSK